jgi:hypothetical protein
VILADPQNAVRKPTLLDLINHITHAEPAYVNSSTGCRLAMPPLARHSANLPTPLTALIGRESEIASVVELFTVNGARLVTLTGPGGVGKTRVAITAARRLTEAFPAGVRFVGLAPVRSSVIVLHTIAGRCSAFVGVATKQFQTV